MEGMGEYELKPLVPALNDYISLERIAALICWTTITRKNMVKITVDSWLY